MGPGYGAGMRRPVLALLGFVLCALGLLLAAFPIVSTWWVSGDALAELPEVVAADAEVEDTRHRLALADPDFLLAERRYTGVTAADVEAALRADGFEGFAGPTPSAGLSLSKECCGEYDAVWITVVDTDAGATAEITVADADIQAVAPTMIAVGSLLAVVGVVLLIGGARPGSGGGADDVTDVDGGSATGRDTMPV